jgi:hypothetical protein
MKNGIIHFLSPEEGGRKTLPVLQTYYATTEIDTLTQKFWSIVVRFENTLCVREYTSPCKVTFLVDDAPFYILDELSEISVYEGSRKVGKIVIGR